MLGKRKHVDSHGAPAMKPDFVAFISTHHDLIVSEVKPPYNNNSCNTGEPDIVKLGRMTKMMINELLLEGIEHPLVGGVLVQGRRMRTFVTRLEFKEIYEMIELSDTQLFQDIKSMTSLPSVVEDLLKLKVKKGI